MATSEGPTSSLSAVINEIAALYPEMKRSDIERLFVRSNRNGDKNGTESGCVMEKRAVFQRDDETIDIADSSSSSSSDDEPEVIESCKEDKTESVKPTPKKAQQNLDDWLRFRTPTPLKFGRMRTFRTPSTDSMDSNARNAPGSQAYENHFLASLSEHLPPSADFTRSEESVQFLKSFHKRKDALVHRLLKTYNEHVFKNRLPHDLSCVWNVRLTKTAGFCTYKTDENGQRIALIELSTKVCDNAERVRDTLIHEMCHAAAWTIHGSQGGHDRAWKYWAGHSGRVFPALPPVQRCHRYQIHAKYVYTCTGCGQQVRRHSKSLDTEKKICGRCHGRFELRENNPKPPSASGIATSTPIPRSTPKFAAFVKSNYGEMKQKTPLATHREIMRTLGETFKKLDF